MANRIIILLVLLFTCGFSYAQLTLPPYRVYTLRDGLPQMQIWSMFQDSRGYLWIGTKGGVSRYDGEKFTNYSRNDGIPDSQIDGISEDYSGNIWIATRFGVSSFDGTTFKTYRFRNNNVQLAPTPDGKVWFAGGINMPKSEAIFGYIENGQMISLVSEHPEIKENEGWQIAYDRRGDALILSSGNKIFEFKKGLLKPLLSAKGNIQLKSSDSIVAICEWKESGNFRLYEYRKNKIELVADVLNAHYAGNERPSGQFSVMIGNNQVYWLKPDTIEATVFPDKWINLSFIDKDNCLWIGTEEGLCKIFPKGFETYRRDALPMIWSMIEDRDKNMWFASYNFGLRKLKGTSLTEYSAESISKFGHGFYFQAQMDERGVLYFPNFKGIMCYDGKSFSNMDKDFCWSSYYDHDRKILFGGYLKHIKAFDLNHRKIREVGPADGVEIKRYVMALGKDKRGNIWMGGNTGLVSYNWETGKVMNYNRENGKLPCDGVFCIHQPPTGDIWFGGTQGLMYYNEQTDSINRLESPEINDVVNMVSTIDSTWLLVSQPTGIYLLDLMKFRKEKKIVLHLYNEHNGFTGLEPGQNGAVKDSNGNIWMTSGTEVVKLNPHELEFRKDMIGVRISAFNGYSLQYNQKELVLPRNDKTAVIQFETICFNRPKNALYSWKIDDGKHDWSPWKSENYAVLTNLRDGKFNLLLKTKIPGLPDNEAQTSLPLAVNIALWKQEWFFPAMLGLVSCLVFLSLVLFLQTRTRLIQTNRQAKMFQLQAILSQLNPHFIFNVMASLQSMILSANIEKANDYLVKMSGLIRGFLDASASAGFSRSKSITASELPLKKELEILSHFIQFQQLIYPDKFDYELALGPEIVPEKQTVPPMLIQPFVENSIKHGLLQKTGKGKLKISIYYSEKQTLAIEIEDDGIGIKKAEELMLKSHLLYTSRGKDLTLKRIKLLNDMGYSIQIKTESSDMGTKVSIQIQDHAK
jgi:ligand-binding sensor domain-containing protein